MLFNSIDFVFFLPIVFVLYWFVLNKNLKIQNFLVLAASYFFYAFWDWRFLSLIVFSSFVDYFVGIGLGKYEDHKKRKILLFTSILVNIGFLGVFKYFNFFVENFIEAFSFFGFQMQKTTLNIVLPVGISFYTFQTLSYSIDVYRRKLKPTKDIIAFLAFVSFFPQLVAGPIERATNLLPQFYKQRSFDYNQAVDGLRQILWGFFKKIVVADNCAIYVNDIFANYNDYSGGTLMFGGILFTFQIYSDFSGYSDIAIGTARLFGFSLMRNFAFPFFSRDIAEFWRRWHISLTTWFQDYVYIPLGGSRGGTGMKIRNTFIIFVVSGFWHGANWTFIFWGLINALYFLPLMLLNKNRKNTNTVAENRFLPNIKEFFQMLTTFFLTVISLIVFRAENIWIAFDYIWKIFYKLFTHPAQPVLYIYKSSSLTITILIIVEWLQRKKNHALELSVDNKLLRWTIYFLVSFIILTFGNFNKAEFIYFAF